jgi:hypothetical protein
MKDQTPRRSLRGAIFKGVVNAEDQDADDVPGLLADAGRYRRGEVVSVAEARRQRLAEERK